MLKQPKSEKRPFAKIAQTKTTENVIFRVCTQTDETRNGTIGVCQMYQSTLGLKHKELQ